MTPLELNEMLCCASTAQDPDIEMVEELLRLGADPLGVCNEYDECALEEVFSNGQDRKWAKHVPEMIKLFLQYGMNVDSSENDVLHPLTWVRNEYGFQTLRMLMDTGLSFDGAEEYAIELIGDILMFDVAHDDVEKPIRDSFLLEALDYAVRVVLLLASYERVFNGSRYIREMLCARDEDCTAFSSFRDWTEFRCKYAFREYGDLYPKESEKKISWILGSATVCEEDTDRELRKIRLIGYLDMERLDQIKIPPERSLWD